MIKISKVSCLFLLFVVVAIYYSLSLRGKYIQAATEVEIVKPVDVVLAVDTSATMGENSKLAITRLSASAFLDSVIASFPSFDYYNTYAYHQVGLVSFNTNIETESLNRNLQDEDVTTRDVKSLIDDTSVDGIFAVADGQRKTATGIFNAKNVLTDQYLSNPSADRVMIIVTDGLPTGTGNTVDTAKSAVDFAKSEGIRVIAIGLGMDIVSGTATANVEAENFIRYLASSAGDCFYVNQYYFDNPDEALLNCNSISSEDLGSAMGGIFDTISSTMFFDTPPSVSALMSPNGPLFSADQFYLQSSARDDIGFKEFYLEWALAENWDSEDLRERTYCSNLSGIVEEGGYRNISVSTGELGSFNAGTEIKYQAVAKDASDNEVIEGPVSVYVANVYLSIPELKRNNNNTIYLSVSDPSGAVYAKSSFYVTITSFETGEKIENALMTRIASSSVYNPTYYYVFNPGCSWFSDYIVDADESYRKYASDISLDISVKAYDDAFGYRSDYVATSYGNTLTNYYESSSMGNCFNSINDDCDFYVSNGDAIVDNEELLCDMEDPVVSIFRTDPDEDYYEVYNDETSVTLRSMSYDDAPLIKHTIYYTVVGYSGWIVAFDCNDNNLDGKCDADISKSIDDFSVNVNSIFPLAAGTTVKYYSTAVDSSGNYNQGSSPEKTFVVKSEGCEDKADLESCTTESGGVCCDGVCNISASNLYDYDSQCAANYCDGTTLRLIPDATSAGSVCATDEGLDDGCFAFTPSDPAYPFEVSELYYGTEAYNPMGCEERSYTCQTGKCLYSFSNRNNDGCVNEVNYTDYECVEDSCEAFHSWGDASCDSLGSWTNLIMEDSDAVIMTGEPEVLDTKTGPLKITASVMDASGVEEYEIQWRVNGGSWQSKSCGTCGENMTCSCSQEIGPFVQGDFVNYYMWSKDASPNGNEKYDGYVGGLDYSYNTYRYDSYGDRKGDFIGSDIDTRLYYDWSSSVIRINSNNAWENLDNAYITWDGFFKPDPNMLGVYTFSMYSDDGFGIYVNGEEIKKYWGYQNIDHTGTYTFDSQNPVPIRIEWFDAGGAARMKFRWKTPDGVYHYAPSSNLIAPYTLTVRSDDCYNIDPGYNEDVSSSNAVDVTACELSSVSGICCGGYCDTVPNSSNMSEECRVDSCDGVNWVYDDTNILGESYEGEYCGDLGTCFEYYTGCQSGNKCIAGYCSPDASSVQVDTCAGSVFTDVDCYGGACGINTSGLECSFSGDSDLDGVECNCDCGGYDIEEDTHSSISLDGSNDYINMGSSSSLNIVGNYSISMWVYNRAGSSSYPTLLNRALQSNTNGYFWIYTSGTNENTINFQYSYGSGSSVTSFPNALGLNEWNQLTFTFNDNAKELKLFVNGEQFSTTRTLSGALPVDDGTLYVGDYAGRAGTGYLFKGYIDDLKIYSRTLYPEEVSDQYDGVFVNNSDLLGYWNFDEVTGGKIADSSGNGNVGYFNNAGEVLGATWTSSGKYNNALSFDGSNDYVSIPVDLGNPSSMSLDFWFYVSESDKARTQYLMDDRTAGNWWFIQSYNPNGSGNLNFFDKVKVNGVDWQAGQWNHLVVTTDSSSSKMYINGALKAVGSAYDPTLGNGLRFGIRYNTTGPFRGKMDEVRIYNRVLSESEVVQHYQGVFLDESNLAGYWSLDETSGSYAYDSSDNGPQWQTYYYNEDSPVGNVVPDIWKVCTDMNDNDCDGVTEDNEAQCDGAFDDISLVSSILEEGENVDVVGGSNYYANLDDIDIQNSLNNFSISSLAVDAFGVQNTTIEWTTDSWWGNVGRKSCGSGEECNICIKGGECYNESDGVVTSFGDNYIEDEDQDWLSDEWAGGTLQILSEANEVVSEFYITSSDAHQISVAGWGEYGTPSIGAYYNIRKNADLIDSDDLYAEQILQMKVCSWDWNYNMGCSDTYYVHIDNSNEKPQLSNLRVTDPYNFCTDSLTYTLAWNYDDYPYGEVDELSENMQAYYTIQIKEVASESEIVDWDSEGVFEKTQATSVHFFMTNDTDFNIDYGKIYKWRVKAADNSPTNYQLESDWVESSDNVVVLEFSYPSVDFTVSPDCTNDIYCESGGCANVECHYGETINFYSSSRIFAECIDDDDCESSDKIDCNEDSYRCAGCVNDGNCASKFGDHWFCDSGVCQQIEGHSCNGDNSFCTERDYAKCDAESGLCISCDEDSQCKKFNTGDTYYCQESLCVSYADGSVTEHSCSDNNDCRGYNSTGGEDFVCNAGMCEDYNYRQWYFGDTEGVVESTEPNPEKIYVISEVDRFMVRMYVRDIFGNSCPAESWLYFGGKKYPTWNEVSPEE
ncbi:MAG: VWA domain-containing protein [Candidatus Pacebacteria bacterium]|nr:VWA domain-containing protein [Candidatus Paceibacterota bacterium]